MVVSYKARLIADSRFRCSTVPSAKLAQSLLQTAGVVRTLQLQLIFFVNHYWWNAENEHDNCVYDGYIALTTSLTSQGCHAVARSDKTWEEKKARLARYQQKTTQNDKLVKPVPRRIGKYFTRHNFTSARYVQIILHNFSYPHWP